MYCFNLDMFNLYSHSPLPSSYSDKKDHLLDQGLVPSAMGDFVPPMKRGRMTPPTSERVMLFVRQENEEIYTPLHVVPPTTIGLLNAVSLHVVSTCKSLFTNYLTPHHLPTKSYLLIIVLDIWYQHCFINLFQLQHKNSF